MKVSINSVKALNARYGSADDIAPNGVDALATLIGARLGGIEEVIDVGSRYQGVIISKVVACEKHPNADKLNICLVDDGGKAEGVERNADGLVQVVCGAPNVRAGLTVAWLPPGSTVPESIGDGKEPFVLGARELRGVVSNGMLASPRELALGDSHEGILEIDEDIASGTDFAAHYGLADDYVLDIENKMFTHRPDCFGMLGVSRELAGIQQLPFKSPEWYHSDAEVPAVEADELPLTVRNELPELVRRFSAVVLRDVQVKASPIWLQVELSRLGLRPINNIVDYTNYFMLLTGQPIHAYDYDKVAALSDGDGAVMVIRHPRDGEQMALLNGKTLTPRAGAMMVATDRQLICVGGAMGGSETEVSDSTTTIIIEAANWDMYALRRTAMEHGIFTDAVTRFTKGQSPLQNRAVVARITDEIRRHAGGKIASTLIDDVHLPEEVVARDALYPPVQVSAGFINDRLGLRLEPNDIENILSNVEFDVQIEGDQLTVAAPFWRTDIEIPEDIVEEVGRLYGFDRLPLELPRRSIQPAAADRLVRLKQAVRDTLSRSGANELLTYSFVHGKLLDAAGQSRDTAYQLSNALSPDLQYFRLSLTPSLLDKVHGNIKAGYGSFALFEMGKAHVKGHTDDDGLPLEYERLALVLAADAKSAQDYQGAAYYQAKQYMQELLIGCQVRGTLTFKPLAADDNDSNAICFEPGRSATVLLDGQTLGRIGEYRTSLRRSLKLPEYAAGFEISLPVLAGMAAPAAAYRQLSRFPGIEQDICLRVPAQTAYADLYDLVRGHLEGIVPEGSYFQLTPIDIYQRADDADRKQITLRLSIASYQKTLRDSEVSALLDDVTRAAAETFGAERI